MKLLIAADMEGITGVVNWEQVTPGKPEYERFRSLMTSDVNAAITGAYETGVNEIVVADGHAGGYNMLIENLDSRAKLHSGNPAPFAMMQGVADGVNSAIFIGYHARAGTLNAVCDHTWSSSKIYNVTLNDRPIGEFGLNAALCGHYGVSVLMVSGDLATSEEAKEWIPNINTVVVKKATSRQSAECLPPEETQTMIRESAGKAVRRFLAGKYPLPLKVGTPITITVTYMNSTMADNVSGCPGVNRIDARTIELTSDDMASAYRSFISVVDLA